MHGWDACKQAPAIALPQVRVIRDDVKARIEQLLNERGWLKA